MFGGHLRDGTIGNRVDGREYVSTSGRRFLFLQSTSVAGDFINSEIYFAVFPRRVIGSGAFVASLPAVGPSVDGKKLSDRRRHRCGRMSLDVR